MTLLEDESATRHLFLTGKGGVGKTSIACAVAVRLADRGRRVLLVSTDPASNLDEVLGVELSMRPKPVEGVPGLFALNVDPEEAARQYRERIVGPYRGVLPPAAVASVEEQLSGACTMEIAAFDEFSRLLADSTATAGFDHIVFDTAPTGHTLRLLALPAAWSGFLEASAGGTSCLGPLSGLKTQQALYDSTRRTLADPAATTLVLVTRPDRASLAEAERTRVELDGLGIRNARLIVNGVFAARDQADATARAFQARGVSALAEMPSGLAKLPRVQLSLVPFPLIGIESLRAFLRQDGKMVPSPTTPAIDLSTPPEGLAPLLDDLSRNGRGVIMTMGKGGVGKTTVACAIAVHLARRGHRVHLTTTDPAAHVQAALGRQGDGIQVSRIDPETETRAYVAEVMETVGRTMDAAGRALLEEELRSPCTTEIAVFRAFASLVQQGEDEFVVIDTAPTGHTLLLLDAAEAYHRQVLHTMSNLPESVQTLLPALRDPERTRILIVTLAEATPVHEAASLQRDLARAGMTPFAWIVNQSLTPLAVRDPVLRARRRNEGRYIEEVSQLAHRVALVPWMPTVDAGTLNEIVASKPQTLTAEAPIFA